MRAAKVTHVITSGNTEEDILRKVKWDSIAYLYERKVKIIAHHANSQLQRCDLGILIHYRVSQKKGNRVDHG